MKSPGDQDSGENLERVLSVNGDLEGVARTSN